MVQDHQKPMHNLLAAANYNTRYALYDQKIIDKALKLNSSELLRIHPAPHCLGRREGRALHAIHRGTAAPSTSWS